VSVVDEMRRRLGLLSASITTRMGRFAPAERAFRTRRRRLAERYLVGNGLEVGALHCPMPLPRGVTARYVDRMNVADLRRHYPEMAAEPLVEVDIVDDGETLATLPDGSTDFIVANHFIEHTEDPLRTIGNHMRVLRKGGILYMAIPDRRHTFDANREPTGLAHLIRDHREGPAGSRRRHYEEWVERFEQLPLAKIAGRAEELDEQAYSIHFHVWTPSEFAALLDHARDVERLPFVVEELEPNGHEFIAILRRS
jgi:SAM-dependent methyltransferase